MTSHEVYEEIKDAWEMLTIKFDWLDALEKACKVYHRTPEWFFMAAATYDIENIKQVRVSYETYKRRIKNDNKKTT